MSNQPKQDWFQSRNLVIAAAAVAAVLMLAGGWHFYQARVLESRPPVILVIIDSLPADRSSGYGYYRHTTPFLDHLAKDGIRYERAVSPSSWSLPSVAGILTGAVPSRHQAGEKVLSDSGELAYRPLNPHRPTLAELFKERGYQTVAFFNHNELAPDFGLARGFDLYDYVAVDPETGRGRNATLTINDAIAWIDIRGKRPFFMVIHLADTRLPYTAAYDFANPFVYQLQKKGIHPSPPYVFDVPDLMAVQRGEIQISPEWQEIAQAFFDAEVVYVDRELGSFLEYLKEKGLYERALIVVTAAHGAEFWERGGFEHGHSLHREVVEVPLVIKYPEARHGGSLISDYVSLLDLFPTLAEFFNWPAPVDLDGVSLYPRGGSLRIMPHSVITMGLFAGPDQLAIYDEGFKLIVDDANGRVVVYDLEADPGETQDLFGEIRLPQSMRGLVEQHARQLENLLQSEDPMAEMIDREFFEKLKTLGYLEEEP